MMTDQTQDFLKMNLQELIKVQVDLINERDTLKSRATGLTKQIDFLRNSVIPDKMEDDGIDNIKVTGIGRVSLHPMTQVSVRSGRQLDLQDWLKEQDAEDLIRPIVNSSTLKAYINERIREGETFPDEIINFNAFLQARITKG